MAELSKIDVNQFVRANYVMRVRVVGMVRFRFRLWIAKWMLKFVAAVIGCDVVFEPLKDAEVE